MRPGQGGTAVYRLILALGLVAATAGCGAGSLLQSPEDRRAEVAAVVADALEAEKGWQTRFVERRTDAMMAEQQATTARIEEVARRAKELEDQMAEVERRVPSVADPGFGRPARPAAAGPATDPADLAALRRDLDAMTGAVAQLLAERDEAEAATRARFERLELRTSRLPFPDTHGDRGVHLASYRTHEAALRGWEALQARHSALLSQETPTFVEVDTVAGRYVRLLVAVGAGERQLDSLRDGIRRRGDYAMVVPLPVGPGS